MIVFLIPLNYVLLLAFFFVSHFVGAVSSYWSRHEIRKTVTYETMSIIKQNEYKPIARLLTAECVLYSTRYSAAEEGQNYSS